METTPTAPGSPGGWEQLAPGVARRRLPFLDVTVGVVVGDDGVLLIDTGSSVPEGAGLRREVRELTGRDVTHIALTHGHFDHVFGTAAFEGVQVFGEMTLDTYLGRERFSLGRDAVRHGSRRGRVRAGGGGPRAPRSPRGRLLRTRPRRRPAGPAGPPG